MDTEARQPSFFDIESKRKSLEGRLRAENYPVTIVEMARNAGEIHNIFQRTQDELKPEDHEPLHILNFSMGSNRTEEILGLLGSTNGTEFDISDYMTEFYGDPSPFNRNLIPPAHAMFSYRDKSGVGLDCEEHLQGIMRRGYEMAIDRLKKIRETKPWLIKLSEKYMDVFQATFVGNGNRCIGGYEGLNFLDGMNEASGIWTRQLPADKEQAFIDSIVDVAPLGMLPTLEKEHGAFNGWGSHTEAFMFTFKNRKPMIGYLNRSFASVPYKGEAWILFSEKKAAEYLAQAQTAAQIPSPTVPAGI